MAPNQFIKCFAAVFSEKTLGKTFLFVQLAGEPKAVLR